MGGSQRATRLVILFVATLAILYTAFVLYDRTAPGGTASPEGNGILLFTTIFVVFAAVGSLYALTPVPRAIEVAPGGVTVVGRWGRRHRLPGLERLTVTVVRRYPAGWLSDKPVDLVELSAEDAGRLSCLVEADLFSRANVPVRSN